MNKLILLGFLLFPSIGSYCMASDTTTLTLENIYRENLFEPERVEGFRSMEDGESYTVLKDGLYIIRYKYNGDTTGTVIFDYEELHNNSTGKIDDYAFNKQENSMLLVFNEHKIYRHSFSADYFIYDKINNTLEPLDSAGEEQLATFSPDGNRIAYVKDNNLFMKDLITGRKTQVTSDGEKNRIINGKPDWVYEEEFEFTKAFSWSSDGQKIAFYRFDESDVDEYEIPFYYGLYPDWYRYKYPKAGEKNSVITIKVYNVKDNSVKIMDTGEGTDIYIPRIKWTNDPDKLSIVRLNRLQNKMDILFADIVTGKSSLIYSETNKYYISERPGDYLTFVNDRNDFLIQSEQDGYNHLYLLNSQGKILNQVTKGNWEVSELLGYDEKDKVIYYAASEDSPLEQYVYAIHINGTGKHKLTEKKGTHEVTFSKGFHYYIDQYSNANKPPFFTLYKSSGELIRILEDNHRLKERLSANHFSPKEFLTVPAANGTKLNAYMIKPPGFDSTKHYPLFMYVYGGPGSQLVQDRWDSRLAWFELLAQQGYIVACVDNRGTGGRGQEFKKCTYLQLGKIETQDQIAATKYLSSLPYIDAGRIGIFGWSYGGYMSLLCLLKGVDVYKMGISVAPVTNWRFYDDIYTERYMRTPQENPDGYDTNSPLYLANVLKGKLLLIHGMADDNVHLQNSAEMIKRLVSANKQFEMQFYPNKNHSITGGNTSFHLYRRMTDFIFNNL